MSLFSLPTAYAALVLFLLAVLGLVLGSALHCLAYRMARGLRWSKGHSVCPQCDHPLTGRDLIPLFSFLLLRGKCRYCGASIPLRYPASEALLGLLFVFLPLRYGITLELFGALVLCCCLFTLSIVDLEIQIIPDRFLLIPAILRLLLVLIRDGVSALLPTLLPALVLGGGVFLISLLMDKVLHKETMGGGDIKLLFVLGLFFAIGECLFLLVCACILGILFAVWIQRAKPDTPFPFGPAISAGAVLTLFFGEQLVSSYVSLFF